MAQSVNLGETPKENDVRDALHIAVISGIAGEKLKAGQSINLVDGLWLAAAQQNRSAVVDPYIKKPLKRGDVFWACLLPNTVTDVKHVWTHPDFPEQVTTLRGVSKEKSEQWLREFINSADCPDYYTVLAAATGDQMDSVDPKYYENGYTIDHEYLYFAGRDAHGEIPPEFWDHVENVTGKKCQFRPSYFSCSC